MSNIEDAEPTEPADLGYVVHELMGPLSAIRNLTHWLKRNVEQTNVHTAQRLADLERECQRAIQVLVDVEEARTK